ncbi:ribosylnicotinamide kinase [Schaereria dolodes]|nr:ribosylnicotinamide kinase [Schaereria dolodes]
MATSREKSKTMMPSATADSTGSVSSQSKLPSSTPSVPRQTTRKETDTNRQLGAGPASMKGIQPQAFELPTTLSEPKPSRSAYTDTIPPTLVLSEKPIPVHEIKPTFLIGISGSTSTQKTSLAKLLSLIFPSTTLVLIVHQNDFFTSKNLLVPNINGELDTDCNDAIDLAALERVIGYVKKEGRLPPRYQRLAVEREKTLATSQISQEMIENLRSNISQCIGFDHGSPVAIIVGFLLYPDQDIRGLLDVRLFLRASQTVVKERRFSKLKYAARNVGNDFWRSKDYFDRMVWRNHVKEHGPLFQHEDVEDNPDMQICKRLGIEMQPERDMLMVDILPWAAGVIMMELNHGNRMKPSEPTSRWRILQVGDNWRSPAKWPGKVQQVLYDLL